MLSLTGLVRLPDCDYMKSCASWIQLSYIESDRLARIDRSLQINSYAVVFVEHSQQTLRTLYLKALPGPLGWAPSYLVPAATGLSIYGGAEGHKLLEFLSTLQVLPGPLSSSVWVSYRKPRSSSVVRCCECAGTVLVPNVSELELTISAAHTSDQRWL